MNNQKYVSRLKNYDYKLEKSPVPLYATGVLWLLYGMIFPLYLWYHYAILISLSFLCFFIFSRLFPPKQIAVERIYKAPTSGVAEVDKNIAEAVVTLKNIEASSAAIRKTNANLADSADKLICETRSILDYLSKNTQKASLLRRFFSYYLPTLDKLLTTYMVFELHGSGTDSGAQSKYEIEEAVGAMLGVFTKQREKLLDDVALDISTDIDVLEGMLNKIDK
ncbi:MAG: 5-bromo-4-chloroindolyl phosphate hydrolysis family protein [Eubacteriales bacterium]